MACLFSNLNFWVCLVKWSFFVPLDLKYLFTLKTNPISYCKEEYALIKMSHILIMVVVTQLCTVVKIHETVRWKVIKKWWILFLDLYFDKGDKIIKPYLFKNKIKPLSGSSFMTGVRNYHSLWLVPVLSIDMNKEATNKLWPCAREGRGLQNPCPLSSSVGWTRT